MCHQLCLIWQCVILRRYRVNTGKSIRGESLNQHSAFWKFIVAALWSLVSEHWQKLYAESNKGKCQLFNSVCSEALETLTEWAATWGGWAALGWRGRHFLDPKPIIFRTTTASDATRNLAAEEGVSTLVLLPLNSCFLFIISEAVRSWFDELCVLCLIYSQCTRQAALEQGAPTGAARGAQALSQPGFALLRQLCRAPTWNIAMS